jgi:hypothetical protein
VAPFTHTDPSPNPKPFLPLKLLSGDRRAAVVGVQVGSTEAFP